MKIKLSLFILIATVTNNITTGPISEHLEKEDQKRLQQLQEQPQLSPEEFKKQSVEKQVEMGRLISRFMVLNGLSDCIKQHDLSEPDAAEKCLALFMEENKSGFRFLEE